MYQYTIKSASQRARSEMMPGSARSAPRLIKLSERIMLSVALLKICCVSVAATVGDGASPSGNNKVHNLKCTWLTRWTFRIGQLFGCRNSLSLTITVVFVSPRCAVRRVVLESHGQRHHQRQICGIKSATPSRDKMTPMPVQHFKDNTTQTRVRVLSHQLQRHPFQFPVHPVRLPSMDVGICSNVCLELPTTTMATQHLLPSNYLSGYRKESSHTWILMETVRCSRPVNAMSTKCRCQVLNFPLLAAPPTLVRRRTLCEAIKKPYHENRKIVYDLQQVLIMGQCALYCATQRPLAQARTFDSFRVTLIRWSVLTNLWRARLPRSQSLS